MAMNYQRSTSGGTQNSRTYNTNSLNGKRSVERRNRIEYRIEYFLSVPGDVVCQICTCVMNEPVKANGHTFCRLCYLSQAEFSSSDKILPYHPDLEVAAKIRQLECYCYYRPDGCTWKGTVQLLENHFDECSFKLIQCYYCDTFYKLKEEQEHMSSKCIVEKCRCGEVVQRDEMRAHIIICPKYISCAKCNFYFFSTDFTEHIQKCQQMFCPVCNTTFLESSQVEHLETVINKESFSKHIELLIKENKETKNQVNSLKQENSDIRQSLSEHENKINELSQVGQGRKDGSLLWVIENVLEKLHLAKKNNQPIFSPSFFSHENGYKMGAKLYLNGDGAAEGEYISLYFFLDKGPFDELLNWPFKNKVALQIMTFGDKEPNIEIFTPEKNALSFGKPKEKRNIPSGFTRFAKQEILSQENYVQNGKLFIKIITDTANMYHP